MGKRGFDKMGKMVLFSGTANEKFAKGVAEAESLLRGLNNITIKKFSDGETYVKLEENIRGDDVFIIQPLNSQEAIWEFFLIVDACKRASARRINAVIPYFGYGRQDRKTESRVAISAKVLAHHIESSGVDRVVTLDLHANQIQGFFDIPVDHLYASTVFVDFLKKKKIDPTKICFVSPDAGGSERARFYAKQMGNGKEVSLAIIDKRRPTANKSEVMNVLGDVEGKECYLVDDMVDTGGTIIKAAQAVMKRGATSVTIVATHAVLSGNAIKNFIDVQVWSSAGPNFQPLFKNIYLTDSYPITYVKNSQDPDGVFNASLNIVSVCDLFAKAIHNIYHEKSVSELFL